MYPSKPQATKLPKIFPGLKCGWLMNITTTMMAISLFNISYDLPHGLGIMYCFYIALIFKIRLFLNGI